MKKVIRNAYHTLTKIGLRKLRDAMDAGEAETGLEKQIKEVETELSEGLQRFPGDEYLLDSERQLAILLSDSERVFKSLQKSFAANPGSAVVALRLARLDAQRGNSQEAKVVLKKALEANRTDRRLHFAYATLLRKSPEASNEELIYHLQRSFTEGTRTTMHNYCTRANSSLPGTHLPQSKCSEGSARLMFLLRFGISFCIQSRQYSRVGLPD